MQTFLPYADYFESAKTLDNMRLGNQCYRECKTLLNGGWIHHPASKMWHGYERQLCLYSMTLAVEMERRGKWKPDVAPRWYSYFYNKSFEYPDTGLPPWLGDDRVHSSHRANLLRKDPVHYGQFGWTETPTDISDYYWPV